MDRDMATTRSIDENTRPEEPELDATPARRRISGLAVAAIVLAVLAAAEGGARLVEDRLALAHEWGGESIAYQYDQMAPLAASGGQDVVVLGSSMSGFGFDPSVLSRSGEGTTAFNASVYEASPRLLELWAEEVVLPQLLPEVVVIGLGSREMNDNGLRPMDSYEAYVEAPERRRAAGEASLATRFEGWLEGVSALVRIRFELRDPAEFILSVVGRNSPLGPGQIGPDGSFVPTRQDYRFLPEFADRYRDEVLNDYQVGGTQLEALERLIEELEARGVRVVLVDMPVVHDDYVPLHPDGESDFDAYRRALDDLASRQGILLIRPDPWDDSFFYDPVHLNSKGRERLSTLLASVLAEPDAS